MGAGESKKIEEKMDFDVSVLDALPPGIKQQIENHFKLQEDQIQELKETHERFKVDLEQKHFEKEKELTSLSHKAETEARTVTELRDRISDLEKRYNETSKELNETNEKYRQEEQKWVCDESSRQQLVGEKEELARLVQRKQDEVERLTSEWKAMSVKVNEANKAKIDAIARLDEIQSHDVTTQHRLSRLEQEKSSLEQQLDWLNRDVREKTDQVMQLRKDKSSMVLSLQSELEEKKDELSHVMGQNESLRAQAEEQNNKIESLIEKLRESRDNQVQLEEQFRNEISAQEKLIHIYKTSSDESGSKVSELVKGVEELQRLLRQAGEANTELENLRKEDLARFEDGLKQRDVDVSQLDSDDTHHGVSLKALSHSLHG